MRALMIAAALAFAAAAPVAARTDAQTDGQTNAPTNPQASGTSPTPNQRACTGPDGKDATNVKCKGAGPAPAASSAYKLDAKGVCRNAHGEAVKKADCKLPS